MIRLSHPTSVLSGTIDLPSSKSISNRLLVLKNLYFKNLEIKALSNARDTVLMEHALNSSSREIDVMDAGTVLRFATAVLACSSHVSVIKGTERLHQRPMVGLIDALRSLGADIECLNREGYAPLKINGTELRAMTLDMREVESSQFVTAIVMILPHLGKEAGVYINRDMPSFSFVQLTIDLMSSLGVEWEWKGEQLTFKQQYDTPNSVLVEKDWSSFYYWFSMACLSKEADLYFPDLYLDGLQSESQWLSRLKSPLLKIDQEESGLRLIRLKGNMNLEIQSMDLSHHPDLASCFGMLYAAMGQDLELYGLEWLKHKESNREKALNEQLALVSCNLLTKDKGWKVDSLGFDLRHSQLFPSYEDHRMVMNVAPLSLLKEIKIEQENCVIKSYPDFWNHLNSLGFNITLEQE